MRLDTLAQGTRKIIDELKRAHGDQPLQLKDVAPENRELVNEAVGGKQSFTVNEVAAGLVDAFDRMAKADRGLFSRGDGTIDAQELAKAATKNPAASPLYTRIAQRVTKQTELTEAVKDARATLSLLTQRTLSGPDYVKVLARAYAPYAEMSPRQAFETARKRYAETGADDAKEELLKAWKPLSLALTELGKASTRYTTPEREENVAKLRTRIRGLEGQVEFYQKDQVRQAHENGPTFATTHWHTLSDLGGKLSQAHRDLEEALTKPAITVVERDQHQAKAQEKVDALTKDLKFIIEDFGIALLSFRPEVMEPAALEQARAAARSRVQQMEGELALVSIA